MFLHKPVLPKITNEKVPRIDTEPCRHLDTYDINCSTVDIKESSKKS